MESVEVRSKKTIRKMFPLSRKSAHLAREMQSITKRLAYLTESLNEHEMLSSATDRALNAAIAENERLRELLQSKGIDPQGEQAKEALFPYPNGEGVAGELSADITEPTTCVCYHTKNDHTALGCRVCECAGFIGTFADPRD